MEEKKEYPKNIWDGAVGARIELSVSGEFLTWKPVRRYTDKETGEWKYSPTISIRNKEAFEKISEQAFKELENFESKKKDPSFTPLAKIELKKVPASEAIAG